MTKEILDQWIKEGYAPVGTQSFRKESKKYYSAYKDETGVEHPAQERTVAVEVEFDSTKQVIVFNKGVVQDGVFYATPMNVFSMTLPTFRLLFYTMKELGWK